MKSEAEVKLFIQNKLGVPGALNKPEVLSEILSKLGESDSVDINSIIDVNEMAKKIYFTVNGKVVFFLKVPHIDDKIQKEFDSTILVTNK